MVIRSTGGGVVGEVLLPNWLPESATQVRWSPDGRSLAVAYGGDGTEHMRIDVIDIQTRARRAIVTGTTFAYPRWDATGEWLYLQDEDRIVKHHLASGATEEAYTAEGLGIQSNGGFDLNRADGALAILATESKSKRSRAARSVSLSRRTGCSDRHQFKEDLPGDCLEPTTARDSW